MIVIPNRVSVAAVMLALALAGGLLTLALLAKPSQAQPSQAQPTQAHSQGATVQDIPLELRLDATECTGELIDITGTMHIVNQSTATEGDGYHITSHFNLQHATGVGLDPVTLEPTGTEYAAPASSTTVENFVHTGDNVSGDVSFQLLTGQGQVPNQEFSSTYHLIMTSEGEVKVEVGDFRLECQE